MVKQVDSDDKGKTLENKINVIFKAIDNLKDEDKISALLIMTGGRYTFDWADEKYKNKIRQKLVEFINKGYQIPEEFFKTWNWAFYYAAEEPSHNHPYLWTPIQSKIKNGIFNAIENYDEDLKLSILANILKWEYKPLAAEAKKRLKKYLTSGKYNLKKIASLVTKEYGFYDEIKPFIISEFKKLPIEEKIPINDTQFRDDDFFKILEEDVKDIKTVDLFKIYLEDPRRGNVRLILRKRKDFKEAISKLSSTEIEKLITADRSDRIAKYGQQFLSESGNPNETLKKGVEIGSPKIIKSALEAGANQVFFWVDHYTKELMDEGNIPHHMELGFIRIKELKERKIIFDRYEDGEWKTSKWDIGVNLSFSL
jgi:hypothetical protein